MFFSNHIFKNRDLAWEVSIFFQRLGAPPEPQGTRQNALKAFESVNPLTRHMQKLLCFHMRNAYSKEIEQQRAGIHST